ncbi:MAG TPA: lysine transporter LysE [Hungateiclostridium thermocellum]|jgi:threonine/homoserine/homoserine lactone efflux protein|uniref:Lysine exporter protein (LYSE/YGGA) n=2 Tax=Acetivibrio thermocellus TaxID=1515 RepID=A3DD86_ACET2|nr:LysE family transporter [Acetivibrio thermocellus]CDG35373.1 lysine exporter protein LysE/YggA [Acetivibrio thermocellus BC1]ABN51915.1 Lysine exporter protein (LYSE/YGGA) [Acetivibrio thermocellus ATCC 27405]ADU74605.1 Lysine exporter protein (LYSE/YGGA) [Acetivibrio thermocellus DSM 1313]ALX08549.1 Lysine exporter protein (LYSE/YGGA) [Acetivibrio thermocellus AD2]ANV76298.1 Lysine exporter protein (LYSE/YGGA) [Acetivibrio thermocellus DSM 2360]
MALWGIFISAFIIGFSGAIMPGPMLGVTIDGSLKKSWMAGPLIVLGHGILELLLIAVMTFGLKDFFSNLTVAGFIGLFGGLFLAWMGYGMIKSAVGKSVSLNGQRTGNNSYLRNLVFTGIYVSATNPYFIIWWASTGMESIRRAYEIGLLGVLFFYVGHILSDFAWYTLISVAVSRGKKLVSDAVYSRIVLLLGIFIIAFSFYFIGSGCKMLLNGVM